MSVMRIAGEVIQIQQQAPAPKAKRGRPAAKKTEANDRPTDQASPQS